MVAGHVPCVRGAPGICPVAGHPARDGGGVVEIDIVGFVLVKGLVFGRDPGVVDEDIDAFVFFVG